MSVLEWLRPRAARRVRVALRLEELELRLTPTGNLLANPGAETGDLTGWTVGGPSTAFVDSGTFDPGINPHSGRFDFVGGSGSTSGSSGTLTQNVALVGNQGLTAAAIDAGTLVADVGFFEQGLNQGATSDHAQVNLTFRDASGAALSTVSTPPVDSHNGTWQQFSGSFPIPAGTRSIDYTILFIRAVGTDLDAFVDDTSLAVVTAPSTRPPATIPDKIGLFHSDGTWTLDLGGGGSNPVTFLFGAPGDQPIVGDWNGAGADEVGTVRVAPNAFAPDGRHALVVSMDVNGNRTWDGNAGGDMSFYFGEEGDQIVLGDWNGDGKTKLGVVRPDASGALSWSLDFNGDHHWIVYHFGLPGDTAIAGDWTGDGKDKIGVARADASVTLPDGSHPLRWSLDRAGTGVSDGTFITFGNSFDVVLVGDWNGDGRTKVGVAGPSANGVNATVFLDVNGDGIAEPSEQFAFGLVGDVIFRGDWTASGTDKLGVARSTSATSVGVTLDSNGDHTFDAGDQAFALAGRDSDEVFVGKWHP
jgi:hypothetical protein